MGTPSTDQGGNVHATLGKTRKEETTYCVHGWHSGGLQHRGHRAIGLGGRAGCTCVQRYEWGGFCADRRTWLPSGYLCFWKDINYGGAMGKVAGNNLNFTAFRNSSCQTGTWNDCISSVYNNGTRCNVAIYRDANYLGGGLTVPRQTGIANLGSYGLNDAISSNRWC